MHIYSGFLADGATSCCDNFIGVMVIKRLFLGKHWGSLSTFFQGSWEIELQVDVIVLLGIMVMKKWFLSDTKEALAHSFRFPGRQNFESVQ